MFITSRIRRLHFEHCLRLGFQDGPITFGIVERWMDDGMAYFIIRDGSEWWSHPGLEPYLDQRVGISLNYRHRELEVVAWPDYEQRLAVLVDVETER